jgi:NAD(P)-dependent dehydrogenase (short-subunit alcohol dehydrogenase family)
MNPSYDFSGQVALVTGAGAGMGLDTARAFAEAGAAIVLADVNEEALGAATDGLTAAGHRALGVTCDVADEDQVAALVDPGATDDLRLGHLTQEWLATSDEPEARTSGGYWYHQQRRTPHRAVLDPRFQDELLAAVARFTGAPVT